MQTKNIVIIGSLTVVGLVLSLFWIVAPALMKDKVVGVITSASADRQCFNYYKNERKYFNDPDSAYIESSRILTKQHDDEELRSLVPTEQYNESFVQVNVLARNGMGGYVASDIICPLGASGDLPTAREAVEIINEGYRKKYCPEIVSRPQGNISANERKLCSKYF